MSKKNDYIVGLDIGTTKICCIIGEISNENQVDIIGLGQYPSRGLRKGVVVNIDGTVESIKNAVEEAELMAGCEIESVFVGIAGGHINSLNSHGIIAAQSKEITQKDVDRVIDAAKAKVEFCQSPNEGMELYEFAKKKLKKITCSVCC